MPATVDCPRYWSLPRYVRRALAGPQLQQSCDPSGGDARSQEVAYVTKVDGELIYSTASWSRYAWRVEIRNATSEPLRVNAVIEFLDSDGTVVTQQPQPGFIVRADAYKTFTGRAWIPSRKLRGSAGSRQACGCRSDALT